MLKLRSKIIVLLLISFASTQCNQSCTNSVKSSKIEIKRFEVDFYSTDTLDFLNGLEDLADEYSNFYPVFVEDVLAITDDYRQFTSYANQLYSYRIHPSMLGLYDSIQFHYPTVQALEAEFGAALGRFYHYFPEATPLEVVTFFSEFGNKAILYKGGIGISLDMFLGTQYPYYKGIQLPNFIIKNLTKEQILPNAMRVLAEDYVSELPQNATLLDAMIMEGKRLYFAEQMLPNTPEYRIIEYTKDQYTWCEENEFNIWSSFIEGNLLYNTKFTEYRRYIEEGPTTLGMPPESPGKIGIWLGWQIVKTYMDRNKSTSLEDLMEMNDSQELLQKSKYKPKV